MKLWLLPIAWALACAAHGAENCEALRTQIETKIGAAGVTRFTVTIADADAPVDGQVVGSCELGSRKIVYRREADAAPGAVPPRPGARDERILTECKDGTVTVGGDCPR